MANQSSHLQSQNEVTFPLRFWELAWYSLIAFTGALGNLLVCLVYCKSDSAFRSTLFSKFLCSLAVADLLLSLTALPSYLLSTPIFNHPRGVWGDLMCRTITGNVLPFYFSIVSEYLLIVICLERLQALQALHAFPRANDSSRRRRAWLSIATAWFIPFLIDSPRAFYFLEYKRGQNSVIGNYCTFVWGEEPTLTAKIYSVITLICYSLIPLVIFIFSFCSIRKCLLREEKRVSGRIKDNTSSDGYRYFQCWKIVQRRQKIVKVLMLTLVVFVVRWIPNEVMFFMINYIGDTIHNKLTWNSPVYQTGVLLGFTCSCANPFLYAWQSREFRKHSKKVIKSLMPQCSNDDFEYRLQIKRKDNTATPKVTKQLGVESEIDSSSTMYGSETDSVGSDTYTPKIKIVI